MSTALAAARAKTKGKRMLRDALEAYGEEEYTLSEWNAIKQQAERDGKWRWKPSDATATLVAVKGRVEKDVQRDVLDQKFATDLEAVMAAELHRPAPSNQNQATQAIDENQCTWRERIGGKQYSCTNELPREREKPSAVNVHTDSDPTTGHRSSQHRMCKWHARECVSKEHPMERSRVIEIPNDQGFCLVCYEATALKDRGTLQKTPFRFPATKLPGVCEVNLKRDVQRETLLRAGSKRKTEDGLLRRLTAKSRCAWEKEHSESAFIWQCRNCVVMHPTLRGAFLPFCGYHAPRCIQEYGASRKKATPCPSIDRRNPFGMCRNHVEAHLSTLTFEARAKCVFADSEFEVPGIVECRRDRLNPNPKPHPLAPKTPPPQDELANGTLDTDQFVAVKAQMISVNRVDRAYRQWIAFNQTIVSVLTKAVGPTLSALLNHLNPVSGLIKEGVWQLQFLRRGPVVAIRIQRIFRGNRARKRVRAMGFEHAAIRRIKACLKIQRIARGYLGRLAFAHELEAVAGAVPTIQRIVRGGLTRRRCRNLRAIVCVQRNFRAYRQRCFAWAMREEIEYMRALQRQADANYEEMLVQLNAFRRLRARRVLRSHVAKWKRRKEEQSRLALERLQSLLAAVKIQRAFRRCQYYKRLKMRYASAQRIQKRVRGWLTRHMWRDDPGLLWITGFISALSGFEYGKVVVLGQPSRSYSFPSRKIRMQFAALSIQRVHRGFMGRVAANMRWVAMLKRWEWLSMDPAGDSSDSMTIGHQRYGFLLPSYNYHQDESRHMRSIKRSIKPDRGYAYKYQSILELIQDRDGKRAWSLAREEKWKRDREQANLASTNVAKSPRRDGDASCRYRHHQQQKKAVEEKSIAMAEVLFPVGCVVLVASTNRRDRTRFHKARVTAVHSDPVREANVSTVDVKYVASFLSVRGVRVYHEPRVPLPRLRHLGVMNDEAQLNQQRRKSVGKLIESAMNRLKREIQESRAQPSKASNFDADEAALDSVDAVVDRFRDEDPRTDLLIDQRDFVNFVFINSNMLRTKWLQVVDHVRYGTRDRQLPPLKAERQSQPSGQPLTPSLLAFYQEFGFDSVNYVKRVVPMPERAHGIEERMASLGFLHEPSANIKDGQSDARDELGQRPQTTPHPSSEVLENTRGSSNINHQSQDDSALEKVLAAQASSVQDTHKLIYELKTLPRERRREKIIEVTTRHARSFICGYPACGRCFSSHEAARLHQEGVHLHQRRLAIATPLVDQYLHPYWPPKSPWNQEHSRSFAPSVGYYHCSHAECSDKEGQFRTHLELQRHLLQTHKITSSVQGDREASREQPEDPQSFSEQAVSAWIWLGTYSLCRSSLERRIEGFPRTALWHGSSHVTCDTHLLTRSDPERCRACFLQNRRITLPCRLYRTVALPRTQKLQEQQQDGDAETCALDGYVIFSVEDPLLCPVVREQDLIALDEDEKDRQKRLVRQFARRKVTAYDGGMAASSLVYMRILTLCRDASGMGWAIGHVFRPCQEEKMQRFQPSRSESRSTDGLPDGYEVTLDGTHIVAVSLEDIRAACIVHRCSSTVFLRKYACKDNPAEMRYLLEPRRTNLTDNLSPKVHRLNLILQRYWRTANDVESDRE